MTSNQTINVTLFKESDLEKRNRELTGVTDGVVVERLDLEYFDTVSVSSSTDNNVRIKRYGPVLIYWKEINVQAYAYCMPCLDAPLLGLKPLLQFKPDFEWNKNTLLCTQVIMARLVPVGIEKTCTGYDSAFKDPVAGMIDLGSTLSFPYKRFYINSNEIEKVIVCDANIERFEDEYNVKIHLNNEEGSKTILILSAKRFEVDLDFIALAVAELAPSFKPIECNDEEAS
ncbi:unnamed protein product [Adineta ricciae]|uniref:Uncharacterized protein n=1 Tax=Adineta ricciae TaxID=249248 RepID=A0A815ZZN3_ADIRI|nr:unnamed protein product [Adineta ricciae]